MALPECNCVTGMPIGEQLGHIYCALVQILNNGGGSGDALLKSANLSDVDDPEAALVNLGAAPLESGVPAGAVMPYAGTTAPSGWLLLFGQAVSRTTYAALFAIVGVTYGAGDGSTTFNLPDLRGRVAAGQDDMGGTPAGRLTSPFDGSILGAAGGEVSPSLGATEEGTSGSGMFGFPNNAATNNTVQPTIVLNYIIKT